MEKLIRDKIISLIEDKSRVRIERDKRRQKEFVLKKILEEANEFVENPCLEEYADLITILKKASEIFEFEDEDILKTIIDKNQERGEFECFYVLEMKDKRQEDKKETR